MSQPSCSGDHTDEYLADWLRDWLLMGCEHDGYHERTCPPCLRDRILGSAWLAGARAEAWDAGWAGCCDSDYTGLRSRQENPYATGGI